jgi:hypothetical protein
MQPCHILTHRTRTTILSAFLGRSRKLLPKWSWYVWIRSCCARLLHTALTVMHALHCFSWNLNGSGPDLMTNNVKNCTRVWSSTLTVQSLCILFSAILLVTTIDVATGSWNWGPSGKCKMGALELNNTPTTMLQPTHLKIHLDMFQFTTRKHEVSQTHDVRILSSSGPTYQWRVNTTCYWQITGVWFRHSYVIYLYCPTRLTEYRSVFF